MEPQPKRRAIEPQNGTDGDSSTSAGERMMSDSAVSTVSRKIESHGETHKEHTSVEPQPKRRAIEPQNGTDDDSSTSAGERMMSDSAVSPVSSSTLKTLQITKVTLTKKTST